jgi:DNA-binding response OmpR family regulator
VLIVDDDLSVLDSLRILLESFGFAVSAVPTLGEALLELNAQRPDVVVTDIFMPDGDGFELINSLREFHVSVPIIVVSSHFNEENDPLDQARYLGAYAAFRKPAGLELVEAVKAAAADPRSAEDMVRGRAS